MFSLYVHYVPYIINLKSEILEYNDQVLQCMLVCMYVGTNEPLSCHTRHVVCSFICLWPLVAYITNIMIPDQTAP